MPVALTLDQGTVPVHIWTRDIEAEALQQLKNIARLPIVHHHVAAMPDVHLGIGATVGAVIPTRGAIIPAAVGVDIGCGMNAIRLSLDASRLPDHLGRLRGAIEAAIPVGFAQHRDGTRPGTPQSQRGRRFAAGLGKIAARHPALRTMQRGFDATWVCQLGTLGSGNHFIELCLDEQQRLWVMLHSGSRGIGNVLGRYFIAAAKEAMQRQGVRLPDRDLAYLTAGTPLFDDYVDAVQWAQDYALENRRLMLDLIVAALRPHLPPFVLEDEAIHCHHNYVARETHFGAAVYVTRKGAIRAGVGELGIIPGSMGARSFIVRGKGHPLSFASCSHGAGRRMSRTEAKRRFSRQDLETQTAGVECRKDSGVLDEIPGAYKDIDQVMAQQEDLVEVVHTLKQVLCVKG